MDRTEFKKKAWTVTKKAASYTVGFGTGVLVEAMCAGFAPGADAGMIAKVGFKAGRHGLSLVCGAAAQNLAEQEIEVYEKAFVKNMAIIKGANEKPENSSEEEEA